MDKQVTKVFKLQLQAGMATPAPPVGTALGPTGVNIQAVCQEYNNLTQDKKGSIIPVEISIFDDRSFSLKIKTPPTSYLIRKALNLEKGSSVPNKEKVGMLSYDQLEEIAKIKMQDMNAHSIESAIKMIEGTARSMGVEVAR
ncbi:50S ribosomal protein L11 [Listeria monocytogenes]|uniref:Large ribosomal subunit protein uL11 n=1 Tax=Listeria monocytogenes TaxID=1639 RepID=A0AAN3BCQ1_LISMN|nr:50S ribosomal protein L11 [Listeria monocytogenes]EAC3367784.1 50S ribosomal protein L11 [Listeria monocytogenes]EAC7086960.1 50S ribosomal protein L11 [Listeria monocytogenes]EAC8542039.1 50S ribosomal protein L11 [Listeria monocytogenes]EAC8548041.1 50S ribosomal protein L11 [Listeria monocytogenes]